MLIQNLVCKNQSLVRVSRGSLMRFAMFEWFRTPSSETQDRMMWELQYDAKLALLVKSPTVPLQTIDYFLQLECVAPKEITSSLPSAT